MTIGNLPNQQEKNFFFVRNILTTLGETLTFPSPCILENCIKREINLNFYFYTSLWCLKRFHNTVKVQQGKRGQDLH